VLEACLPIKVGLSTGAAVARVFISYASEELALAMEVARWLVGAGHEVFLDKDPQHGIAVGDEWEKRLHERLRWANAVVCIVTSAYLKSAWCTAEVSTARSRGNRLLPLRAEPGVDHQLMRSLQYADLTKDQTVARSALVAALRRIDAVGDAGWPDDRSPFPGLLPFDADRHTVFFGRNVEIEEIAELLRSAAGRGDGAALLVVGPSGCGKSSLARAGLLPTMGGEPGWWTLPPMAPGTDPLESLSRAVHVCAIQVGLAWPVAQVHGRLAKGDAIDLFDELLHAAPGTQRHLLIVIDQFEELFTLAAPEQRAAFAASLYPALHGPVNLVVTLRPEYLDQLLTDPDHADLKTATYALRPLRPDALQAIIEEPARIAGIGIDESLVARLIQDTGGGEALPLLAFTLQRLADGVRRGGRLSAIRYDQLGGVRGALAQAAGSALTYAVQATGRHRADVVSSLLRLVTVDDTGRPVPWRVNRDSLDGTVLAELDAFISRRLLTTDTHNSYVVIAIAHEAFLTAWRPLTEAVAASASALRARRGIEQAASEWDDHGRSGSRLWSGGQLAAALRDTGARLSGGKLPILLRRRPRVLVSERVDLNPRAREFLQAGIRHDRRRRRRATTVLSLLLVLALAGAGIAVVQQRIADQQRKLAENRRNAAEEQQRAATARQLVAQADATSDSDPRTALRLGIAAQSVHPDGQTYTGLVNTLANTRYTGTLTGHTNDVTAAAFSPDGHLLATASADTTAILWDLTDPTRPHRIGSPLRGHTKDVTALTFSSDGQLLVTASSDATAIVWDLTNPAQPRRLGQPLAGHANIVLSVAFAPNSRILATAGSTDNTAILWDLTDPANPRRLGQPLNAGTAVYSVAFSPDGHRLATGSVLWNVTDPTKPRRSQQITGDNGDPNLVAFSANGRILASIGSGDGSVVLRDLTDPNNPRRLGQKLGGDPNWVHSVAFAPDGLTMATAGFDATTILWDLTDPTQPRRIGQPLTGHTGGARRAVFSPDGRILATVGISDDSTILWDMTSRTQAHRISQPMTGHQMPVQWMTFSPDRRTLATGSREGAVILWDVTDPAHPRRLAQPLPNARTDSTVSLAFAPNGRTLAIGGVTPALWDVTDPAQPRRGQPLTGHTKGVRVVAFSPDGRTLVTTGTEDKTMVMWNVADSAQPRRLGQPPLTDPLPEVRSVAFAPNRRTMATGSVDGTVILWDVTDPGLPRRVGQPLMGHTTSVNSMAFAPDGHILASGSQDSTVALWDVTDPGLPRRVGQPLTGHTSAVDSVIFAPRGRMLASSGLDGTVLLWELTDPNRPRRLGPPLTDHTDGEYPAVDTTAFAPDGNMLAISAHLTFGLWDVSGLNALRDRPTERACSIAGGLTEDEWARYIPGLPYMNTCRS
jgi:WD40 repeat protein